MSKSFFKLVEVNKITRIIFVVIVAFCLLAYASIVAYNVTENKLAAVIKKKTNAYKDREIIGKQLYLKPFYLKLAPPLLNEELSVFFSQQRPDTHSQSLNLEMQINNSKKKMPFSLKEQIYLKNENDACYEFSENPTDFWLKPISYSNEYLLVESYFDAQNYGGLVVCDDINNIFKLPMLEKQGGEEHFSQKDCFKRLIQMKWWGKDLVMEKLKSSSLELLEISEKKESNFFFFKNSIFLIWENNQWQKIDDLKNAKNYILVKISKISTDVLEVIIWEENGDVSHSFTVSLRKPQILKKRPESVITSLFLRNKGYISCKLGAQRLTLKQGSWLIKNNQHWQVISSNDLKNKISSDHKNYSELIFFEKIEEKDNQKMVKGYLYNSYRNQCIPFMLPMITNFSQREKKQTQETTQDIFFSMALEGMR